MSPIICVGRRLLWSHPLIMMSLLLKIVAKNIGAIFRKPPCLVLEYNLHKIAGHAVISIYTLK